MAKSKSKGSASSGKLLNSSIAKNTERIQTLSAEIESLESKIPDNQKYADLLQKIEDKKKDIDVLDEDAKKLREKEIKDLETQKDKYDKLINQLTTKRKKLQDLEKVNRNLIDGTDEYESALRSIGSRYGEINSIYKEGEKILDITKENISGIISLTSIMNTQNADILPLVLATQKGYRSITTSIVESIGSLEDSESAHKRIGIQIDEQEKSVVSLGKRLDEIQKTDPESTIAKDLKKQLLEQVDGLHKMKDAAKEVSLEMQRIDFAAKEISGTMVGGWIDKFLGITKMLGITKFGNISEAFESLKKPAAQKALNKLNKLQDTDVKIEAPDQKTAETLTKVEGTKIEAPDQKTAETLTKVDNTKIEGPDKKTAENLAKVEDGKIEAPTELEMQSVTTGGPLEKQQTKGIESLSSEMQTVAKNTKPAKNKSLVARLEAMGTKQSRKQAQAKEAVEISAPESKVDIQQAAEAFDDAGQSIGKQAGDIEKLQGQQLSELEKNAEQQKNEGASIDKVKTDVGKSAGETAAGVGAAMAATSVAGMAAAGVGIAIAAYGLAKEMANYEDSIEAAADAFLHLGPGQYMTSKDIITETIDMRGTSMASKKLQTSMEDTEEYRKLLFQYGIKSDIKERQNLETDYFNYSKGVYMDYFNYQQSLAKDELDFRIGLERDALQFGFQQAMANLEAEGEKRKTLAGSAMKFIKDYGKVSERALNAIGSSTKAIMDGMKQFGAILGGTNKSQFELVENAQGLAYEYGASSEEVLNVSHMFKLLGNTTDKVGMGLTTGLRSFVEASGGNVQAVFAEIAASSADIYRLMAATPQEIAKQATALQKAGVKLSAMLKASDTMVLNYKDSIKAEMSLGASIGRNVQFTQARASLMAGDMVGAANAIRNSLAGIDVSQFNPFQRDDLMKATGLTVDQVIQIQQGKEIETEEDKQLKMAELTGKTIADATLKQDVANASARLALEQAQRREMLEFEQNMRLLTLRLEQKQRLEQIPIESQFRIYYDKMYAKKFAEEDMYTDIVEQVVTSTYKENISGAFDALKSRYDESLQNLGLTQIQSNGGGSQFISTFSPGNFQGGAGGAGGAGGSAFYGQPQIESLGKTVVDLDDAINQMGIRSTDNRYMDWLMETGKIGMKFKKGKIDATTAESEYKATFDRLFGYQIEQMKKMQKEVASYDLTLSEAIKGVDLEDKLRSLNLTAFLQEEGEYIFPEANEQYKHMLKKYAEEYKEGWWSDTVKLDGKEFDVIDGNIEVQQAFGRRIRKYVSDLETQYKNDIITREQFNAKLNELMYDLNIEKPNIQPPGGPAGGSTGGLPIQGPNWDLLNELNKGSDSMLIPRNNPNTYNPFPSAFFNPNTWTPDGTYQPGGGFGLGQPDVPNKQTGVKQKTPDGTPLPGGGGVKEPSQVVVNMDATNAILSKIQSEAQQRGIEIKAIENKEDVWLASSAEKLHNAKMAVEGTKMDTSQLVAKQIPSMLNLEKLQIEMIEELRVANDVLSAVAANTAKEGTTVITLDNRKVSDIITRRAGSRKALGLSNTINAGK